MPSGKRSRQQRQAAPPPVRSKGGAGGTVQLSKRTLLIGVVVVLVIAGLGIGLGVGLSGGGSNGTKTGVVDFSKIAGLQTGAPPWNNGLATLAENLSRAHLSALPDEGTVVHIHQHLDIWVNGKKVEVPADIGIDPGFFAEIHVHDTSGIIHVESPTATTFYLGQVFGEWAVRLSSNCLGTYCGHLKWWVNGKKQTGNPADLALSSHQEIVIVVGKPPKHIPSSYGAWAAHGAS